VLRGRLGSGGIGVMSCVLRRRLGLLRLIGTISMTFVLVFDLVFLLPSWSQFMGSNSWYKLR